MGKKLQKYLDEAEKTEQQIAELEERLRTIRAAQKKEEDSEIIRAIRSTKMGGRELLALLDNIQAGNVTFLTAVNNASEEAETEEAIEKDKSYDGRFSHSNKEWAEQVSTPEHNADRMTFRTDWVVDSHPAILDGFVTMFRKELEAQKEQEQPFVKQFYVVENLQAAPLKIERFGNLDDAMSQYQALPNHYMKALGVEKNPDPLPGSLDVLQCRNGIDTIVEDYKTVPGWDNPYIQNHVAQPLQGALAPPGR